MSSDRYYLHEKIADARVYEAVALIYAVIGSMAIVSGFYLIVSNLPLPVSAPAREVPIIPKVGGIAIIVGMTLLMGGLVTAINFSEQKSEYMKKMENIT